MVNIVLSGLEKAAVLWFGALLVLDNVFSVGMFMAFSAYSAQFSGRMMGLIDKIVSLRMLRLQTERLADILLTEPDPQPALVRPQLADFGITFRDVWFRHADNEPWLYQGLNFTIAQGESVAITGPSGCGKSTLLKLMLGIYTPQQGEILLGGQPLRQLGPDAIREYCATVMQDDMLFAVHWRRTSAFLMPHRRWDGSNNVPIWPVFWTISVPCRWGCKRWRAIWAPRCPAGKSSA